ncbi:geranylgeranyl pyrophosphate synthase [Sphaerisporangium krabiense]|uniref:Heptaprenyl diphosphate synthase n=1 Tax=Sphaerisporangium krabiense TaxID=763782 RepID=A0A7W8ZB25_9ACTN|nr:polyprenyl synthetase family protein [Sphaerisporangium krabiense]MBB5630736.1 heptaprenyl diphosphate synthase [Sphaerisporangium krabiense]GII65583.1 geranylgeranyl pyrophosphate synthase [Sphaerisporangium krabiense]
MTGVPGPLALSDGERPLAEWTRHALAEVEELLAATLRAPGDPFLTTVATHLLAAGGKRLRPRIALLAARFGDPDRPEVPRAAAAVELIHVASLYHDDVMDEAATRRGVPSVNARWGNRVAILAGDYLVARAAELVAPLGPAAAQEQARMMTRLVTGQLRETVGAGRDADPERYYMRVIADKTAALFALAARLGAQAAGAGPEAREALGAFGEAYGVAYQLCDDVLDIAGPDGRAGKPAGADLRQGVATLPVLRALRGRGRTPARLRGLLARGPVTDPGRLAAATRLLRRSPGLAEARAEVARHAGRARHALDALPGSPARAELIAMCAHLAARASGTG